MGRYVPRSHESFLSTGSLTPIASSRPASKSAKSSSPRDHLTRSAVMSVQPLFTPVRMGDLDLPNRIVMAPLTRMRAGAIDHVPTALQAEYYAQQASSGLIVAKATAISPPITSGGKVEDNHPDRAAYLGHGLTAYAALTRGLAVHPGEAVFVSSGAELPRNFVDGPIIWKGI